MRNLDNFGVYKALLLAGCAGAFSFATPALAQDAARGPSANTGQGADCNADPQDPRCIGTTEVPTPSPATGTIVVTGSRIARQDFNSNSPLVTVDEALLENSSTAALESNLNRLPQFTPAQTPTAGGDIQPTATNTPGAATISLRGIGANRNLVLIDGRRSTPSNASGVTDISTIPAAAIERVEVITGGASATYGADAVAGVSNFILKKNFQGLELDARAGITQEGDNFEYQLSGIMGTDFADGRGNISLALSVNNRESAYQRDREAYQRLYTDPQIGGVGGFFSPAPGYIVAGNNAPNNAVLNSVIAANPPIPAGGGYTVYFNPNGTAFTGIGAFAQRGGVRDFAFPDIVTPDRYATFKQTAIGTINYNNLDQLLILPLNRYNAFARGNYELNDWIGVFGQALLSSVETFTTNEAGPITSGWDVFIPYGTGVYTGSQVGSLGGGASFGTGNPSSVILNGQSFAGAPGANGSIVGGAFVDATPGNLADNPTNPAFTAAYRNQFACAANTVGGCTNNQVLGQFLPAELQQLLNSRPNPNAPFQLQTLMPGQRSTFTDVLTFGLTAGLEGKIPGTDWTWEAFVSHGESHTFARQTGVYSLERVQTVLTAPAFGRGFSRQGNPESGGFGASTGTCTSGFNFFNPPAGQVGAPVFSRDCLEAVSADLKNRSKTRQTVVEANIQGGLFQLPAGDLRFAAGASYRELNYSFLNDTLTSQGRSFLDNALGIYPSGDSFGDIRAREVYGELLIPVLKDVPFFQELNLEVGLRMSSYNTTGTSYTYKILGDWALTDWLRIRGGYNRAERSPNVGELFLSAQQTFGVNNAGDVCSRLNPNPFSANPAVNPTNAANVEAVCRVLMAQSGNPDAALQYYGTPQAPVPQSPAGFGFAFPTTVGNPNLIPEKADTYTLGVVIQSPFQSGLLSRLRLSVDGYDITINDVIGAQTVGAVQRQCFDPVFNPLVASNPTAAANSQFCQLLPRNQTGQLGNVRVTYANAGHVHLRGIDTQLDWSVPVGPGRLSLNALVNYQLNFETSPLYPQIPMVDYVGTLGTSENGLTANNAYEYRLFTTLGYSVGKARVALQWQHLPAVEDAGEASTPGGTPNTSGYPAYDLFNLNTSYQLTDDIGLRFGVDNLLDKQPPLGQFNPNASNAAGQLRGGSYIPSIYDTNGRRFYIGGNVRF